jgi:predicted acylesterase/phospholipase RssA
MSDFLPKECDIVMEGGVTSGVVYPAFVARLAERFTLRSIGGTSVGAVAAITAAAAQFKRNRVRKDGEGVDDGFHQLARLPGQLQESVDGRTRLFSLFQPCAALRPHFRVIAAALNETSKTKAAGYLSVAIVRHFPLGAMLGAGMWLLGFLISSSLLGGHWARVPLVGIASALWFGLCMFVGALGGALLQATLTAWRGLRANRCGICSGLRTDADNPPALTEWLHALVQDIAGLPPDAPLTFGQLRTSEPPIELALMTTGLSELRAHRLPHSSADLVFRASELSALFPPAIVDWMKARSRHTRHGARTVALLARMNAAGEDYYFIPDPDDLPLVVAARMSLSFPVLLQAVPLFRLRALPVHADGVDLLRVWFSDGGLTSNFPIHFFDDILPTRPTFGVTLQDDLEESDPFAARVSLPSNNNTGVTAAYLPVDEADGRPSLPRFTSALLRTIRTWRDEALKRTPGYRDRVVQIRHTKREGGLNLNMTRAAIDVMSRSGDEAARQVIERFLDPVAKDNGWLNHRWVRMRSTAAVLQETFAPLAEAWHDAHLVPSYEALWMAHGVDALPAYQLSKTNRTAGFALWERIVTLPQQVAPAELSAHAPQPQPELVIAPRLN